MDELQAREQFAALLEAERYSGTDYGTESLLVALSLQGILLGPEGKPYSSSLSEEELSTQLSRDLAGGKSVYLYRHQEEMPISIRANAQGSALLRSSEPVTAEVALPPEPAAPKWYQYIGDFFARIVGSRNEACRKYDEFQQELSTLKEQKQAGEHFEAQRELRREKLNFAESCRGALKEMDSAMLQRKRELNFDADEYAKISVIPPEKLTQEQKDMINHFHPIVENGETIKSKLDVLARTTPEHLASVKSVQSFQKEQAEALKELLPKVGKDFSNVSGLSYMINPPGGATNQDYLTYYNAVANLQSNTRPEEREADIQYLRGICKENLGKMNDRLQETGLPEHLKPGFTTGEFIQMGRAAFELHGMAQLTYGLGNALISKGGQKDLEMMSMASRVGGIYLSLGPVMAACGDRSAGNLQRLCPLDENIHSLRAMQNAKRPMSLEQEYGVEKIAEMEETLGQLSYKTLLEEKGPAHSPEKQAEAPSLEEGLKTAAELMLRNMPLPEGMQREQLRDQLAGDPDFRKAAGEDASQMLDKLRSGELQKSFAEAKGVAPPKPAGPAEAQPDAPAKVQGNAPMAAG